MIRTGQVAGSLLALIGLLSLSSTAMAQHLDKHETRALVRHLQERSDEFQDKIDDWIAARAEERGREFGDLTHQHVNDLQNSIDDLKVHLREHDNPWDLRDEVRHVIDNAREVNRALVHTPWYGDLREAWEPVRDAVDHLAEHYQLPPLHWER